MQDSQLGTGQFDYKSIRGWFFAASLADLKAKRLLRVSPWGRSVLLTWSQETGVQALSANCLHQGAELSRGSVENGELVCPYHHWRYSLDGKLKEVPEVYADHVKCHGRRLKKCGVRVFGEAIFVSNSSHASDLQLDYFTDFQESDFEARSVLAEAYPGDWVLPIANGFDVPHFAFIHDRKILSERVERRDKFSYAIVYEFENVEPGLKGTLSRWMTSRFGQLRFCVVDANTVFASVIYQKGNRTRQNHMLINSAPVSNLDSRIHIVPFMKKPKGLLAKVLRPVLRLLVNKLIRKFFRFELDQIREVKVVPAQLLPVEHQLQKFLYWLHAQLNPESSSFSQADRSQSGLQMPDQWL